MTQLSTEQWNKLVTRHNDLMSPIIHAHRERRKAGVSHPIHDFLFTYYSYSTGRLLNWHPTIGVQLELEGKRPKHMLDTHYSERDGLCYLDVTKLTDQRRSSIRWMITLLENTANNTPNYGCFGMHEWAMVYKGIDVRHKESVPLRLSQAEVDTVVESRPIQCSHYDAFRFFPKQACGFNKLQPQIGQREFQEQPACVHANMDLYKWTYKCMPWVGSDLLVKTFKLALEMRELDMRASPYDLSQYGSTPICIETAEGRKQYESTQRELATKAQVLRSELIDALKALLENKGFEKHWKCDIPKPAVKPQEPHDK